MYLHEKLSIFIKSPDFNEITDFSASKQISEESLIPFAVSSQKIVYFHKMNRFQGISCLISKDILLVKNTNFSSQMLYRSVSNEQISRDFLPDFKREPSTVWSTCIKNYIYSQNEQISVHLCGKLHIFIKLPDFNEIKEMNRFQSNYRFQ